MTNLCCCCIFTFSNMCAIPVTIIQYRLRRTTQCWILNAKVCEYISAASKKSQALSHVCRMNQSNRRQNFKSRRRKDTKKIPVLIIPHETLWHSSISSASESPRRRWKLGGVRKRSSFMCQRSLSSFEGKWTWVSESRTEKKRGGRITAFFRTSKTRRAADVWALKMFRCRNVRRTYS